MSVFFQFKVYHKPEKTSILNNVLTLYLNIFIQCNIKIYASYYLKEQKFKLKLCNGIKKKTILK